MMQLIWNTKMIFSYTITKIQNNSTTKQTTNEKKDRMKLNFLGNWNRNRTYKVDLKQKHQN